MFLDFTAWYKLLSALMKNAMEYVSNRLPGRNLARIYPAQRFFSSSDTRKIPCFPDVPELSPTVTPLSLGEKFRWRSARTANSRASSLPIPTVFSSSKCSIINFLSITG